MLTERVVAFVWTCAIELPVYAMWLRKSDIGPLRAIATIIALQIATHPLLWTLVSHSTDYVPTVIGAELAAVLVEAGLLRTLTRHSETSSMSWRRALAAAFTANLASVVFGLAMGRSLYGAFTGPK